MHFCRITEPARKLVTLVASCLILHLYLVHQVLWLINYNHGFFVGMKNLEAVTQEIHFALMDNLHCEAHTNELTVLVTSTESQDKSSIGTVQVKGRILAAMENYEGLRQDILIALPDSLQDTTATEHL